MREVSCHASGGSGPTQCPPPHLLVPNDLLLLSERLLQMSQKQALDATLEADQLMSSPYLEKRT